MNPKTYNDATEALATAKAAHAAAARSHLAWQRTPEHRAILDNARATIAQIPARTRGAPARRATIEEEYQRTITATPTGAAAAAAAAALDAARAEFERLDAALDSTRRIAFAALEPTIRSQHIEIRFGAPSAYVETAKDWSRYSKTWHRAHGPALTHTTIITIPPDWTETVADPMLATAEGRFVLAVLPTTAPDPYHAWTAITLHQGRGYAVTTRTETIARLDPAAPRRPRLIADRTATGPSVMDAIHTIERQRRDP
jgi:multidrug efflux pump subunit AcrA (membrane-fusion protein)